LQRRTGAISIAGQGFRRGSIGWVRIDGSAERPITSTVSLARMKLSIRIFEFAILVIVICRVF
jgi:hypothetical protein